MPRQTITAMWMADTRAWTNLWHLALDAVYRHERLFIEPTDGKSYRVYMLVSDNKFLRVYCVIVKVYLKSLEQS